MIAWTDWPARRRPRRAILAAAFIAIAVMVFTSMSFLYGFLAAFVLLTVSAEVLLPTRFRLSSEGVEALNLFRHARKPWERFEGWRTTPDGFVLTGRGPSSFLARRRSVWVPCPGREAQVQALLTHQLGKSP